jgi:hypothetical protein
VKLIRQLIFALLFIIPLSAKASIDIRILSQSPAGRFNNDLSIRVSVTSTFTLDTVLASVNGRSVLLKVDPGNNLLYTGNLSLTGLTQGTQTLSIYAKDILGNNQTTSTNFIFDSKPAVTVELPTDYTAWQSKLHIKASVSDPGNPNCKGKITVSSGALSIGFNNNIDTLVDVIPGADEGAIYLVIMATDTALQNTQVTIPVYCDKSTYLHKFFNTSEGRIIDFRDNRVLVMVVAPDGIHRTYKIFNVLDSSSETILLDSAKMGLDPYISGVLCKNGAAFVINYDPNSPVEYPHAYVWKDGSLINISGPLGIVAIGNDLQSYGDNLMWLTLSSIGHARVAITDLNTLITTFIGTNVFFSNVDIKNNHMSRDGKTIAYSESASGGYAIYKYTISTHSTEQITHTAASNLYPLPDNMNVAYLWEVYPDDSLHFFTGVNDYNLGKTIQRSFDTKNGYLLYSISDNSQPDQAWLRSPNGTKKQLSFFSVGSSADKLGDNSASLFINSTKRYYTDSLTTFKAVSGSYGTTYYQDSSFYLALGNSLFRYSIPSAIAPAQITGFTPDTATTGTTVTIRGKRFTGVNAVSFGNTAVNSYTVISDSVISAIVGIGASGNVTVSTAAGIASLSGFVYVLPADNFTISNDSTTCKGSADGAIHISAIQNSDYTAVISGAKDTTYTFTSALDINNLSAGSYSICIMVTGQPGYQQCFTSVISQPQDLSVYIDVNKSSKEVILNLSGSNLYHVTLNDVTTSTRQNQLTLTLRNGLNRISVNTDNACQGVITQDITIDGKLVYPNPFQNSFTLNLGPANVKRAVISVYSPEGRLVYSRQYTNHAGIVSVDLSEIGEGLYILKLLADGDESVFKLLKR